MAHDLGKSTGSICVRSTCLCRQCEPPPLELAPGRLQDGPPDLSHAGSPRRLCCFGSAQLAGIARQRCRAPRRHCPAARPAPPPPGADVPASQWHSCRDLAQHASRLQDKEVKKRYYILLALNVVLKGLGQSRSRTPSVCERPRRRQHIADRLIAVTAGAKYDV
jgi:hypothetical protein